MFNELSERFSDIFKRLKKKAKLSEKDVDEVMREVRIALLQSDVNLKVAKEFANRIKDKAIGREVLESLTPAQEVVRIVRDELIEILGKEPYKLNLDKGKLNIIMLAGLQGSGKTTTAGKLALYFRKKGYNTLLVAADVYRYAAIEQLKTLGKQINIDVYSEDNNKDVVSICKAAVEYAKSNLKNVIILDTAGRLHIDDDMMKELEKVRESVKPDEIFLVIDSMLGQLSVDVAKEFNERLEISGVILTKLDGDARGGAALSVRYVTGKPIIFIGVSEKLSGLEYFYPDRMASRILGMGDVLSLIEKVEQEISVKDVQKLTDRLKKAKFDFNDYLNQLKQVRKLGSFESILSALPLQKLGLPKLNLKDVKIEEKELKRIEAMILSMTPQERANPDIIKASRKRRIAKGSGMQVSDVNKLIKNYKMMKDMFLQFAGKGKKIKKRNISNIFKKLRG